VTSASLAKLKNVMSMCDFAQKYESQVHCKRM